MKPYSSPKFYISKPNRKRGCARHRLPVHVGHVRIAARAPATTVHCDRHVLLKAIVLSPYMLMVTFAAEGTLSSPLLLSRGGSKAAAGLRIGPVITGRFAVRVDSDDLMEHMQHRSGVATSGSTAPSRLLSIEFRFTRPAVFDRFSMPAEARHVA